MPGPPPERKGLGVGWKQLSVSDFDRSSLDSVDIRTSKEDVRMPAPGRPIGEPPPEPGTAGTQTESPSHGGWRMSASANPLPQQVPTPPQQPPQGPPSPGVFPPPPHQSQPSAVQPTPQQPHQPQPQATEVPEGPRYAPHHPAYRPGPDLSPPQPGEIPQRFEVPVGPRPGLATAIGIMTLTAGIVSTLWGFVAAVIGVHFTGLCVQNVMELAVGVFATIHGFKMVTDNNTPPPKGLSVLLVLTILNCNILSVLIGILNLVFMNMKEVRDYYELRGYGF